LEIPSKENISPIDLDCLKVVGKRFEIAINPRRVGKLSNVWHALFQQNYQPDPKIIDSPSGSIYKQIFNLKLNSFFCFKHRSLPKSENYKLDLWLCRPSTDA